MALIFFYSLSLMIFSSYLFFMPIFFFAPFLAILFFKKNFTKTLLWAFFYGLVIDLFSSKHFGLFSFSFVLTSFFLYSKKKFFKETALNISFLSSVVSFVFTIVFFFLYFIFEKGIKISFLWIISDLLIMPVLDGVFAFILFVLPMKLFAFLKNANFVRADA